MNRLITQNLLLPQHYLRIDANFGKDQAHASQVPDQSFYEEGNCFCTLEVSEFGGGGG
jgi:hypothetical protein